MASNILKRNTGHRVCFFLSFLFYICVYAYTEIYTYMCVYIHTHIVSTCEQAHASVCMWRSEDKPWQSVPQYGPQRSNSGLPVQQQRLLPTEPSYSHPISFQFYLFITWGHDVFMWAHVWRSEVNSVELVSGNKLRLSGFCSK